MREPLVLVQPMARDMKSSLDSEEEQTIDHQISSGT